MKLSQYKFDLPTELVAKFPAKNRDESRLMVLHRDTEKIEHKTFKDIINYFDDQDVMVFNDTKVFPAGSYGNKEKTGAEIEVFLLRELNREQRLWDVLVDPARKIRIGNKLYFGEDDVLVAEVIDNTTSRGRTLRFCMTEIMMILKRPFLNWEKPPFPNLLRERLNRKTRNATRLFMPSMKELLLHQLQACISAGNY